MFDILFDIFMRVSGLLFAFKRKWFARGSVNFYHRLSGYQFNEKMYQVAFLLGGILSIILGIIFIYIDWR